MLKIESSIVINRPIEEVFAVVRDHENYPKWDPGVLEVKKTSSEPIGLGTTWRSVSYRLGKRRETESEIVEYEPNRKITRQHTQGMPVKAQFTCENVAGGTRVTSILEAEPGGFFKLVAPVLAPLMKGQLEGVLANLKKQMEAHAL